MKMIKKNWFLIALLACVMIFAACGAPAEDTNAPADTSEPAVLTGAFSENDLGIAVQGKIHYLREDSAEVLAALGDEYEYSEMVSCVYDGKDKTYAYAGITVNTVPVDGKDIIEMFTITDTSYTTLRGITVGATRDEIIAAYGEEYFDDGWINYTMTNDQADVQAERIQFEMNGDTVSAIYIYSPSY